MAISVFVGTGIDNELPVSGVTNPVDPTKAALMMSPLQAANFRVTAGGPAPGQVQKNYSGTQALSASATTIALETVTALRSYLVTDISATISGSTGQILIQLQVGGINVWQGHVNTTKGIELQFETGPIAQAGQIVQLVAAASASSTLAYNIYGVEY